MKKHAALNRALKFLYQDGAPPAPAPAPRKRNAARPRAASASRHNRKCCVCRHVDRKAIERDFLSWRSADRIAEEYAIADHSSIYRHAHATGLFSRRASTVRLALSPLIEKSLVVPVTADSIVRAVIAFAHINDDGQWIEPPRRVVHESHRAPSPRPAPDSSDANPAQPPSSPSAAAAHPSPPPNRTSNRQTVSSTT
jgi:hypothetical protein